MKFTMKHIAIIVVLVTHIANVYDLIMGPTFYHNIQQILICNIIALLFAIALWRKTRR